MKITVITATYNSAQTLSDTIESVFRQTHKDIDYIIVDGASKDGTLDIIKQYEPKFEGRLRYVSEPDRGIYDAMNKGIKMAEGEVIGLLNSDDFYTSDDVLEKISAAFEETNVDAVYGDVHYVAQDDLKHCTRYYSSRAFRPRWMRLGFMPAHPSFYCKRSVYQEHGLYNLDYKIAADFEQLLRLLYLHRIRTSYLPFDFVTMRTGGASSSGFRSHKQIMKDHLRALRNNGVPSNFFLLSLRYPYKIFEIAKTKCSKRH